MYYNNSVKLSFVFVNLGTNRTETGLHLYR